MVVAMWIIAGVLGTFCLLATIGNYFLLLSFLTKKKHGSFIPLVGGITGMLSLSAAPTDGLKKWAWLPLFLDIGSLPLVIVGLIDLFVRSRKKPE